MSAQLVEYQRCNELAERASDIAKSRFIKMTVIKMTLTKTTIIHNQNDLYLETPKNDRYSVNSKNLKPF